MTSTSRPTFLRTLDRTSTADLAVLVLGPSDDDSRDSLLERVRVAAARAPDRTAHVAEIRREVAELMFVRLHRAGLVVTWAGLPWAGASSLRAEDRVRLSLAAQDAAVAELLADRLSPDERDRLRGRWDVAASMPGLGWDGTPAFRAKLRVLVAFPLVVFLLATGLWPLLVILAVEPRRRRPDEVP